MNNPGYIIFDFRVMSFVMGYILAWECDRVVINSEKHKKIRSAYGWNKKYFILKKSYIFYKTNLQTL